MDLNYFNKLRILDGGMGQELLANGLITKGTLWSTTALLDEKDHQLVIDTHISFINSGSDVIVTNNFSSRKQRLIQNRIEDRFDYVNIKDAVAYYWGLLEKGVPGEIYNVCTGVSKSGREFLLGIISDAGKNLSISTDPDLLK